MSSRAERRSHPMPSRAGPSDAIEAGPSDAIEGRAHPMPSRAGPSDAIESREARGCHRWPSDAIEGREAGQTIYDRPQQVRIIIMVNNESSHLSPIQQK